MLQLLSIAFLVLVGHVGWWIFCYNRINATGLPRLWIKRVELLIIALIVLLPMAFIFFHGEQLVALSRGQSDVELGSWMLAWIVWSIGCVVLLGPGWIESRFWLWPPANLIELRTEWCDVATEVDAPVTGQWLTRRLSSLPLNEITQLSVTHKTLQLQRVFAPEWDALTIGHLSDLHFTGGLTPDYYHFVIDRLKALSPDLIALTGDIVDTEECLEWIEPILGHLSAPLGCFFVLGNHERRLKRPAMVAERLSALGWHDLGVSDAIVAPSHSQSIAGRRPGIVLTGNERPWFERHRDQPGQSSLLTDPAHDRFVKIALSHSPDEYPWARDLGIDLMLAGHTHGGQVRLPVIGPLIAPSRYGSRFASGVFRLPPTLLHVSRGLSGTQPLRWRCPPEISQLTVIPQNADHSDPRTNVPASKAIVGG